MQKLLLRVIFSFFTFFAWKKFEFMSCTEFVQGQRSAYDTVGK